MKLKKSVVSILLIIVSIIYILLIKLVDVASIGPKGSEVGFSSINGWFNNIFSYNSTIYKITEVLGYIALLIIVVFALLGLYQLIKRKSIKKVDKEIIVLGIFYVIVLFLYVLFDKVAINYRPVLLEGVLEPSFPSSHTLLAMFVCGSAVIMNNKLFEKNEYKKIINVLLIVLMVLIIVGRLLSGVHWITDVVGGILIATTLLYIFNYIINYRK